MQADISHFVVGVGSALLGGVLSALIFWLTPDIQLGSVTAIAIIIVATAYAWLIIDGFIYIYSEVSADHIFKRLTIWTSSVIVPMTIFQGTGGFFELTDSAGTTQVSVQFGQGLASPWLLGFLVLALLFAWVYCANQVAKIQGGR